jgi:hypothetical protein
MYHLFLARRVSGGRLIRSTILPKKTLFAREKALIVGTIFMLTILHPAC